MQVNAEGRALIKRAEGLSLEAYRDNAGRWVIGYGHLHVAHKGMSITESEADGFLDRDIAEAEKIVAKYVKVALNENEFSALASFVFNIGESNFRKSQVLKRLNRNDRMGAADAFDWWTKARMGGRIVELQGVTWRRAEERALFLQPMTIEGPMSEAQPSHGPIISPRTVPIEEPDRRQSLFNSRTIQGAIVSFVLGLFGFAAAAADLAFSFDMDHPVVQPVLRWIDGWPLEAWLFIGGAFVFAMLYVIWARIDDWRQGRR